MPASHWNRNVVLNLLIDTGGGLAFSVWGEAMLVAFLFEITDGSNKLVGLVTAVQGFSELLTAMPAGWAADRYSASLVCSVGGAAMLCASLGTAYAVVSSSWSDNTMCYAFMCGGLALFGLAQGIVDGPAQALLANSLPTGARDKFYNYCFVGNVLGSAGGPLLGIILFSVWDSYSGDSDHWPVSDLRVVILAGLALEVPLAVLLCFFKDECALGTESRSIGGNQSHEPLSKPDSDDEEQDPEEQAAWEEWMEQAQRLKFGPLTTAHVPYIVFASDLCCALASGMTVNFFPLFFKDDCAMSAAQVQTVYLIAAFVMAAASTVGERLTTLGCLGRPAMVILMRVLGLTCFSAMVVLYDRNYPVMLIVAAYIVRTACMNCTTPLEEGLLMDYAPKEQRARWKTLESVSGFGWAGSAAIGGVLSDWHGYSFTFIITIVMQATATVGYCTLVPLVTTTRPEDVLEARKACAAAVSTLESGLTNSCKSEPASSDQETNPLNK